MLPRLRPAAFALAVFTVSLLCGAERLFAQVADFDITADSKTDGCFPLTVEFVDRSTGSPTSWKWDFGNGKTSELQNPKIIFSEPGTYDVSLTVSNGGAPKTLIRSAYIKARGFPNVDFSFDETSGCAPLEVTFKDKTTTAANEEIANWFWVFGDGGQSTSANPHYTFQNPGERLVSLKVRNIFGCEKTKSITSAIKIFGPTVKFVPDATSICTLPATFNFTNQSTGNGLTYQWTFGDGQNSTTTSPSHAYNISGTYDVTLKGKDNQGCEQSFKLPVNAGTEGDLDFTISSDTVCLGVPVTFKLISGFATVSTAWTFGDGNGSPLIDPPAHPYNAPGTYTVTLDAFLLGHTCHSIVTKKIVVAKPAIPDFDSKSDCSYKLTLTNKSQNATRVEWYIDDQLAGIGNTFVSPKQEAGTQDIRIVAYDLAGCTGELEKTVAVTPKPVAGFEPNVTESCDLATKTLSGCAPFEVHFHDKTKFDDPYTLLWEFGDGQIDVAPDPVHTYQTKGLYQVTLTAKDGNGCSSVATSFVLVDDQLPDAAFTMDKTEECPTQPIKFTATTDADNYCWYFGDGKIGNGKSVVHAYWKPGIYQVKLIAKNAGCSKESQVQTVTIRDPNVDFGLENPCDDPFYIKLTNKSSNYTKLSYTFGDGHVSDIADTVTGFRYANEGTYLVTLHGETPECSVDFTQSVTIQVIKAKFAVNTTKPCKGAPIEFTDQSNAAVSWTWGLFHQLSNERNFTARLKTPGTYTAALRVLDSDGCMDERDTTIQVLDLEGNFRFTQTSNCDSLTVKFENISHGDPPPTSYEWDFGDGKTSTATDTTHAYHDLGDYTVRLAVTRGAETCVYSRENAISFTVPIPGFATSKTEFCPESVVQVANTTTNAIKYEWDYGDGRRADFQAPAIIYEDLGTYDISLFATDAWGCEKKITKEDFVIIEKPAADFTVEAASGACPPFTAVFSDKSKDDIQDWDWDFGDGQTSDLPDPANVYLEPGKFNVKLTVIDNNGCSDTKTVKQFVTVGGPTGNFVFSDPACVDDVVTFNANVDNTAILRWDFGDGTVVETRRGLATHSYAIAGTFTPALLLLDPQGCQNLADGSAELIINDTTAFDISIGPDCIRINEPFILKASSEHENDIATWSWLVDGIDVGAGQTLETTADKPGLHIVTGLATNRAHCVSHVIDTVRVQGPISMIPNVITPNGDEKNPTFRMTGLENSTWDLHVINRWGTTVYNKKGYNGDWDGEGQPDGVYYFVLHNAVCEERDYKGFISIVR